MPFMGKDWRSPGEAWVKTETLGWQRMKIIESQLHPGCHQISPCSWPPRSEFGQHMANNCNKNTDSFSSDSSNSSSDENSSSQSSSPIASPERGKQHHNHQHHLHPLAISSPYGQHPCCVHHLEYAQQRLVGTTSPDYYANAGKSQQNAQVMSRSLSRELLNCPINNNGTTATTLRSNNSVPDFKLITTMEEHNSNSTTETNASQANCNDACDSKPISYNSNQKNLNKPILMKNGSRFDDNDPYGGSTESVLNFNRDNGDMKRNSTSPPTMNCCCINNNNRVSMKEPYNKTAPHCRISVRTREVAMYNTISEAFYRLDFCNAIHDIRRFNYICKLLHLLITQNLTSLSGCATRVLFTMLEQVAWEVSSNKRNIHVLKNLLNELKDMIRKYYCWGRPIGSSLLWQQHFDTIERISQIVDRIELSPPKKDDAQVTLDSLPVEMIREILLRLNDYRDLVNSAQASPVMRTMVDGQYIWRKLCKYHFTEQQLRLAIEHNYLFPKRGNVRGLKYARTISADGKTSFRNPVTHKFKSGSNKQQLEQMNGSKGNRHKDSSSYVTRAIKVFNEQDSTVSASSSKIKKVTQDHLKRDKAQTATNDGGHDPKSSSTREVNQADREIDWERIFHQLRKKFDLKEEYPDCLLLCRHCRCLFWKSFGHPCIKNDEVIADGRQQSSRHGQNLDLMASNNEPPMLNGSMAHREQVQNRLSVAALSRNFDNRALNNQNQNIRMDNMQPLQQQVLISNQIVRQGLAEHNPLNEIRNDNQGNIDLNLRDNRIDRINNDTNTNNTLKRRELIPKHVAISPQAFLKFFSL